MLELHPPFTMIYVKGASHAEFVGGADKCLYEAKEAGRNKSAYK